MLLTNFDRWSATREIIKKFGYKIAVEVGVRECFFSDHLLYDGNLEILYGLDIKPLWNRINLVSKLYPGRFEFIEGKSPDYSHIFGVGFFDFIYIDAGHTYEEVKDDLNGWWPKLRVGGTFMGDDYMVADEHGYGVIAAVNEFVQKNNLKLFVTGGEDGPNEFEKFRIWAKFNSEEAVKNNQGKGNSFKQNVQWYIIKEEW